MLHVHVTHLGLQASVVARLCEERGEDVCATMQQCGHGTHDLLELGMHCTALCMCMLRQASKWTLQHKGRQLDMALPLRLAGVPRNSALDMVPCDAGMCSMAQSQCRAWCAGVRCAALR